MVQIKIQSYHLRTELTSYKMQFRILYLIMAQTIGIKYVIIIILSTIRGSGVIKDQN